MSETKPIRVVFFGDSICVGQGVSIHRGWVARLASRLDEFSLRLRRKVLIVNASVNGNTTRQALERMPYDVQSRGVDLLLVQFGLNDCNYWQTDRGIPRVSLPAFRANLDEIVDRGRRFGASSVFVNTNHLTSKGAVSILGKDVSYEDSNRAYNAVVRTMVAERKDNTILNDIEMEVRRQCENEDVRLSDLLLEDGLHLSEKGHDVYYQLIMPVIESELEKFLVSDAR